MKKSSTLPPNLKAFSNGCRQWDHWFNNSDHRLQQQEAGQFRLAVYFFVGNHIAKLMKIGEQGKKSLGWLRFILLFIRLSPKPSCQFCNFRGNWKVADLSRSSFLCFFGFSASLSLSASSASLLLLSRLFPSCNALGGIPVNWFLRCSYSVSQEKTHQFNIHMVYSAGSWTHSTAFST